MLRDLWLGAILALAVTPVAVLASDNPSTLREVMVGMGQEMCRLNTAILQGDHAAAASAAQMIAEHPTPSLGERLRMMMELGSEVSSFKRGDDAVSRVALELREAAEQKDNARMLERYLHLMAACVECHDNFRARMRLISLETHEHVESSASDM